MRTDGTCPTCGRAVDPGRAHARADEVTQPSPDAAPVVNVYGEPVVGDDEKLPLPWHLKLLAGALAIYLGYRFLQGIEWVVGK